MKTKYFFCQTKEINAEARTIDVVASTADLDRDNEIILPSAFAKGIASFKANPVILACHQHRLSSGSSPVIGSADPDTIKITDKDLGFTMRFANTPLGDEYFSLYRDKHMKAFSVGFIPKAWEDFNDGQIRGRRFTNVELLEVSAVPVPANPNAVARAMSWYDSAGEDPSEIAKSIQAPILDALEKLRQSFLDDLASLREANKSSGDLAALRDEINNLADDLGELKNLLADSGGYGRELLGGSPDADPPAGRKGDAESVDKRILEKLKGISNGKKCND
jgi:HK97 family phage prohead protease